MVLVVQIARLISGANENIGIICAQFDDHDLTTTGLSGIPFLSKFAQLIISLVERRSLINHRTSYCFILYM